MPTEAPANRTVARTTAVDVTPPPATGDTVAGAAAPATLRTPAPGGSPAAFAGDLPPSIAGYELLDRLGVGGYGEVWRAVGPGGLQKAVKVLHGRFDGPQAEAELKSLERIRDLRHPFLLNVERIEVGSGRLVIVTELAEGSLEDRFEAHRREGRKGVPRDELLAYLRDAADALDFLYDAHGLQHLDVKPGNLLVQSGHVKVADFGLVKDVRQSRMSLVGGFTPLYAPPELFEGCPSRASDQYSLAVVFQQMLTGVAPFGGRTAAQLASQHLSTPPDLTPLPVSDRPAVARGLAKSPRARFATCREFVDALSARVPPRPSACRTAEEPSQVGPAPAGSDTALIPHAKPAAAVPLPPVAIGSDVRYRPTVFVGLGGVGGKTLAGIRRRIARRFGSAAAVPAVAFLYADTDAGAVQAARSGADGLDGAEVAAIPLRDPKDYRASSGRLLEWLSRRWLFNIPRSREVEGIRPLGRLAFVDHHEALRRRVREAIAAAAAPEAVAASAAATGLPFDPAAPRVVLVAATSGGTGGGAVLDAAYLVRDVTRDLGLEPGPVLGLLLHATDSRGPLRTIHRANSVACLKELHRFRDPAAGYPGDPACRLSRSDRGPFDATYVVHLGDGLADEAFHAEIDKAAEYLYRDAATPARGFFAACRPEGDAADDGTLRTFGVSVAQRQADAELVRRSLGLARAAVRSWRGGPPGAADPSAAQDRAAALIEAARLTAGHLVAHAAALLRRDLVRGLDDFVRDAAGRAGRDGGSPLRAVDDGLDAPPPAAAPGHPGRALAAMRADLDAAAARHAEAFAAGLASFYEEPGRGLDAVAAAAAELSARLGRHAADLDRVVAEIDDESDALAARPGAAGTAREYAMLRICAAAHRQLVAHVAAVRAGVLRTAAAFADHGLTLRRIEDRLVPDEDRDAAGRRTAADDPPTDDRGRALVAAFDRRLRAARGLNPGGLFDADPGRVADLLRDEAVEFLLHAAADAGPAGEAVGAGAAAVGLSDVGGEFRLLAVHPNGTPAALAAGLGPGERDATTTLRDPSEGPFLCREVEGLAIDAVIARISGNDPVCLDAASRLHTRIDVDWG